MEDDQVGEIRTAATARQTHGSSSEPVRSRWTPKPEQILILESIFNSGMVNPPKEETIKIRKLLEKFGSVGDANVFYWFQNRRSRSRRRQRQIQASTLNGDQQTATRCTSSSSTAGGATRQFGYGTSGGGGGNIMGAGGLETLHQLTNPYNFSCSSTTSCTISGIPEFDPINSSFFLSSTSDASNSRTTLHHHSGGGGGGGGGVITVFINGVQTEVERGPLHMKAMFGQDVVLVHSSGLVVPFNDHGFSLHSLQHGESYFLVSRPI